MDPEPSVFVLLKRSFWGLFGAIWLVAGAGFILIGSVRAVRDGDLGFPIIGVIIAAVGAVLLRRGLVEVKREERLRRVGVPTEATVTAVLETNFRYNRVRQWVVHYRYADREGQTHEGKSGYLNPEEAVLWEEGQTGRVLFDPERSSESMWFGNNREQLDEV
jgi:hypothetical protein